MRVNRIFVLLMLTVLMSCDKVSEIMQFVNCKYDMKGLSDPTVGRVNLTNVTDVTSINPISLLELGAGILAGSLPFQTTLNINATNPNTGRASMDGLEWAIDLENSTVISGFIDDKITVEPNGSTVIPIVLQMDIMQLIKGESKDNVFKFVNNLLNIGDNEASKMTFKIKPTINIAGQKIPTGFININKTVN